ncbi:uncharacterized protein LOC127250300 isoform X2 [Andrographis paniculata]|uniref:uncharacterized protein LOC127250300 isoform X2 n=1 Tax=Andrographis paniculata TaxID=175694 RepID=UPI0021E7DFFA|nr:uncharacterized protein LOC127250300 isoform X2 [Andrographis paniculata]
MAGNTVAREELLRRWSVIEQEDDIDGLPFNHSTEPRRLRQLKEQWFSDAFNLLIHLPKETHVWCGYWDLMGPLLETFYNYFKEECVDSPLKILWSRLSKEMRSCTLCIHQHHQAQQMYDTEYERSCISPLLDVLHMLDEARITQHLKDLNAIIARGEYDTSRDYGEVVSVMFEVLMFPVLLDDLSLAMEFQNFIEAIDNSHELMLDGHQQYPGVYALLFFKSRRVRSIGLRLAGHMGKLRKSTDLDPLQHLLKKWISILEPEGMLSVTETPRPRVNVDRLTVWLGMKALVGFLEPPAFEEGVLDRYPIFLSIVLNHISDDSLEFSHAVNCLRLLFEKLGCKLWLRATLSPSVMRNTLLGQCFHTRIEKSHKEIFDLFQPFLQSLEALQDGEHEKQRRHFLYFLLHQVPVSSNFSVLMRKKIALFIVLRGYRMDPPCPPSECAHMWGPSLVSSLKDSSLHNSLRQPAIDLIQTIIVSDAAALISVILRGHLHPGDKPIKPTNYRDVEEEEILSHLDVKENNTCWKEFSLQYKNVSQVDGSWMCVPMLWIEVLVEIDPLVFPLSFSKAVFWALSRFSVVEPASSTDTSLSIKNWFATQASEISFLLGWKVPSGSDDGGGGTELRNSIKTSTMCLPLVRTFKRLTADYAVRMGQGELRKQWTWEPEMSSCLILLLVDSNDNTRQVGRLMLEQVSDVRGLTGGLQFLCCTQSSLLGILLGLRHALKLVQLDSVLSNFSTLHHLFFILYKVLREGNSSVLSTCQNPLDVSDLSKTSMQGGFFRQPVFDCSSADGNQNFETVTLTLWEKFCCLLSQVAWPSILRCLDGGKTFTCYTVSQMTCIRILEAAPAVFERLPQNSEILMETFNYMKWLHDLADWGKSSLAVVTRYWKQALVSLLGRIKTFCINKSLSAISDIEKLISCEKMSMDEVTKQVARLSVSIIDEGSTLKKTGFVSSCSFSREPSNRRACSVESEVILVEKEKADDTGGHLIILSDDEREPEVSVCMQCPSDLSGKSTDVNVETGDAGEKLKADLVEDYGTNECLTVSSQASLNDLVCKEMSSDTTDGNIASLTSTQQEHPKSMIKEAKDGKAKDSINLPKRSGSSKQFISSTSQMNMCNSAPSDQGMTCASNVQLSGVTHVQNCDEAVKGMVCDADDDAWNFSFFKPPKRLQPPILKPNISGPKRQIIQLSLPVEHRPGSVRLGGGVKRFQPPRLDNWYRPILELDFFGAIGPIPGNDKGSQNVGKLKEVPVYFQSPDEYIEIFRPLVLEEFKAQMLSSFQEMSSGDEMCCGSISVLSVERIDDFHLIRFVHDENDTAGSSNLLENDLILLTRQPMPNSVSDVHTIGKVERREKDNNRRSNILTIRLYLQGSSRLNRVRKLLTERSKWYISRIMNITPQLREFQALSSIREIPLLPVILNPVNNPCGQYKSRTEKLSKLPQPLQQIFSSSYNGCQLQAISLAIGPFGLKDFELTLIQGPPGTGKTRTIVAIIRGLLAFSQIKDMKNVRAGQPVCSNVSSSNQKISQSAAIARAWQDAALARQLNEDVKDYDKSAAGCTRRRILICSQSNAAVDELVARISSEDFFDCYGEMYKPYLVRVGNVKTVHPKSLPFFIDKLVENRIGEEKGSVFDEKMSGSCSDSLTVLRADLEKLVDRIRYYEAKRSSLQERNSDSKVTVERDHGEAKELSDVELQEKLRKLYEEKKALYSNLVNVQAREKKINGEIRALRHKFRMSILKEAEIVVTTLSGCGGDLFSVCSGLTSGHKFVNSSENTLFDAVLIDEAAQALEPATLIPLQLLKSKGTKCIMVGDPKQLPATVLSNVASKYLFQCSMFERFQRAGHPIVMLTQQYRMHPEICRFPSSHFYEGKLLNGDKMSSKDAPFHEIQCLGPYVFFDITDGEEIRGKSTASVSLYNHCEADAAVEVLRFFKKSYNAEFFGGRIGIITPYKRQMSLLHSRFSNAFGSSISSQMEFNTVDGFQGREVDILLLSTVRATGSCSEAPRSSSSSIGFVADVRRMNVALTRAKLSLWIFGNARTLQTNQSWAALIDDAKRRSLIVSARKPYNSICKYSLVNKSSGNPSNVQLGIGENVTAGNDCVNVPKGSRKHPSERKRKLNADTVLESAQKGEGAATPSVEDGRGRGPKGRNFRGAKDDSPVAMSDGCNKELNGGKLKLGGDQVKTENRISSRASNVQGNAANADVEKGPTNDVRRNAANTGKMKNRSKKSPISETIKNKQLEQSGNVSSSERSLKEKGEPGDSSKVGMLNDAIMKRKQLREEVDTLLSSSLISSKKPNQSTKSVKKLHSTSDSSGHFKARRRSNGDTACNGFT